MYDLEEILDWDLDVQFYKCCRERVGTNDQVRRRIRGMSKTGKMNIRRRRGIT